MPHSRIIGFVLAVAMVTLMTTHSLAQIRPAQRVLRLIGQGYGDGYNLCAPAANSNYYNPYSAHNSFLVSQSPKYLSMMGAGDRDTMQRLQQGTFHRGVPFSVYAAPRSHQNSHFFQQQDELMIQGSYEPLTPTAKNGQFESSDDSSFEIMEEKGMKDKSMEEKGMKSKPTKAKTIEGKNDSAFVPRAIEISPPVPSSEFSKTGFQRAKSVQSSDLNQWDAIESNDESDMDLFNPFQNGK